MHVRMEQSFWKDICRRIRLGWEDYGRCPIWLHDEIIIYICNNRVRESKSRFRYNYYIDIAKTLKSILPIADFDFVNVYLVDEHCYPYEDHKIVFDVTN